MSSSSHPPSSTSKPSSRVSKSRSIHDIISSLRSSFRDADFIEAEQELLWREENLRREKEDIECSKLTVREQRDFFEAELSGTRLEAMKLKAERAKLERECEIYDGKLSDLERELSLAREKEAAANKRYGKMCEKVRVIETEKEELLEERQKEQSFFAEKQTSWSDERADLMMNLRGKDEEIDGLVRKNHGFEKRENEAMAQLQELRAKNGCLEERIKELENKIEIVEMEKRQVLKENEDSRAEKRPEEVKIEEIEKHVSKLESYVATWMSNVPRDQQLGNVEVEKILSFTLKAIDSEGIGGARALGFEPGTSIEIRAGRVPVTNIIEIESGSDDDDELHRHELKKRSLNKRKVDEGSSEDSLNPKNKIKKLNDLAHETSKHDSSISTPLRQTASTVIKCNEKLREGSTREDNKRSTQANTFFSPQVKELLAACRRSKAN